MKNRTRMLNKILEFFTHRAVQRCFTWSTILAISVIYLTQEMTIKIENHFYQNLHTVVSISTYFLTIWFNSSIYFSSSHFTRDFLLYFFNFSPFFRCYSLNAGKMPVPMSELHCGSPSWLVPLNFMVEIHLPEPFSTPALKVTHHDLNHMHSDRFIKK